MLIYEGEDRWVATVEAGRIRLDGGAMFGVVPRPLWERRIEPDDRNRIPLAMRCLLIRASGTTVLVDTGIGHKENEKFEEIYGVENEGRPTRLEDGLRAWGVAPGDVDVVLCTHLHFDHAGGATVREADGTLRAAFPNARYVVRRGEWEFAHRDNERIQASYLAHNFDPLESAGMVEFIERDTEVVPGVHALRTPGHTPYHQSVLVEAGDDTLFYPADLVPTEAHVPLPWIMGYDVEPLRTLESKREWLGRAGREGWVVILEHDPRTAYGWARPGEEGGGCELVGARPERGPPETETGGDDAPPAGDGRPGC